jgi:hypothetical protein
MILAALALAAMAPRYLMAHYMPWFQTKAAHGSWGWHWTMGRMDPDKGGLASQFHPLIGPYDSRDPDVIEYQLLTMKLAGIDGVLVDWYGIHDLYDYRANQEATAMVFAETKKLGMKFGLVYEDQTMKALVEKNVVPVDGALAAGRATMNWVAKNWFGGPNYLRADGKPVMLVFGPQYFKPEDWMSLFGGTSVAFYTLHHQRGIAVGAYDWPLPHDGDAGCEKERQAFLTRAKDWPSFISSAYPRFQDYYKQAGVHDSWGSVLDSAGQTYVRTLTESLKGAAPIVQLVTWNDWGEGTQIEPSREFGYRDLVATQRLRKQFWTPKLGFSPEDIGLPAKLFALRKKVGESRGRLDSIAAFLASGEVDKARRLLTPK